MKRTLKKQFSFSRPLPRTHWGFPVAAAANEGGEALEKEDPSGSDKSHRSQRGVALILAIMVISVMMMFTTDMIVSSQVGLELSVSHRDNVKAELMAKSAQNLANFLLVGDMALDLFLASPQSPMKQTPQDTLGDMWGSLNGIPIGGGTAEMMLSTQESFSLNKVTDNSVIDQLKLFDGEFTVNISDESGKIDINYCAQGRCSEVIAMLMALFNCPAEKVFLEDKKVNARELAYRIKDWVDSDTKAEQESGYTDENDPYQKRTPPYKAKNAPFDSLDELKMIEGWDDDMHRVFAPYISMWPFQNSGTDKPKLNLNTTSKELLSCFFPPTKGDCSDKTTAAFKTRDTDKSAIGGAAKTDIAGILKETFCYEPLGTEGESGGNKTTWFQMRSNVFRVEAIGEVGNQRRIMSSVIERRVPDKKESKGSSNFLYWREQ